VPTLFRICGSIDGAKGDTCMTTKIAACRFAGNGLTMLRSASTPPAEAPITIMLGTGSSLFSLYAGSESELGDTGVRNLHSDLPSTKSSLGTHAGIADLRTG